MYKDSEVKPEENTTVCYLCGHDSEAHSIYNLRECYMIDCDCKTYALAVSNIHNDTINHPRHYTEHPSGVECIQITEHMNFCLGNAIKYIWRADSKNGIEDLLKAQWYINREIERRS